MGVVIETYVKYPGGRTRNRGTGIEFYLLYCINRERGSSVCIIQYFMFYI
jgi:hypothetical protein